MVVQWLRLWVPDAGDMGLILTWWAFTSHLVWLKKNFNFFALKGTIKKVQTTHRMKEMIANHNLSDISPISYDISLSYLSDISPISRIFKEFLQLNNNKSVKQSGNRFEQIFLPRRYANANKHVEKSSMSLRVCSQSCLTLWDPMD